MFSVWQNGPTRLKFNFFGLLITNFYIWNRLHLKKLVESLLQKGWEKGWEKLDDYTTN